MFDASSKDFGSETNNCKSEFYEDFQMLNFDPKQSNKSLQMILHMVQNTGRSGSECLENGDRFNGDASQWIKTGVVSIVHCFLPFLIMLILWLRIAASKCDIWSIPFAPLTRIQRSILDFKFYKNKQTDRSKTEFNVHKQILKSVFKEGEAKITRELKKNQVLVNIGTMLESGLESTLQVIKANQTNKMASSS